MSARKAIRQQIRSKRQQLTAEQQEQASEQLLVQVSQFIEQQPIDIKRIALYLANDGELNPEPVIHYCWQQGIEVYLPVLHPFTKGHLLFLHHQANVELVANCYGIQEPKLKVTDVIAVDQLDIVFTPLVAFDLSGQRLGMGGGYYDRTFANHIGSTKPLLTGLAHDCQQVDKLPSEAWDVPLTNIITPSKQYKFRTC